MTISLKLPNEDKASSLMADTDFINCFLKLKIGLIEFFVNVNQ